MEGSAVHSSGWKLYLQQHRRGSGVLYHGLSILSVYVADMHEFLAAADVIYAALSL